MLLCAWLATALTSGAQAGEDVPVPEPRPSRAADEARTAPTDPASTEPDSDDPAAAAPGDGQAPEARSADVPLPVPRPTPQTGPVVKDEEQPAPPVTTAEPPVIAPRPAQMPAGEVACRKELTAAGVAFEEAAELADPEGCSVPWPISISSLSKDVKLTPGAVLNCATALRAATFTRDIVAPRAQSILGSALVSIRQDSAYVCRPRHRTAKLSEHAFGNALDIGAFALADDRSVVVGSAKKREEAEFMLAVRLAACGPFTTVLGPGSDADHAAHFHLDLAERRSGSLFCQ